MTLAEQVLTNLLAMDAYFKGYSADPGGFPPGFPTGNIGNAEYLFGDISDAAVAEGFYAAAYRVNGFTVISYRGTDAIWPELAVTDVPVMHGN